MSTKVLRRLGLEDGLIAAGIKSQRYISRAWDTGETCTRSCSTRRASGIMAVPMCISIAATCTRCWNAASRPGQSPSIINWWICGETSGSMRLVFANGATAEADIVVGADGIRSKVREFLLGPEPPQFVGAVAYRAIFPAERLNGLHNTGLHQMVGHRPALPALLS